MENQNKREFLNVSLPIHALVKESEKSVLIHITGDQHFWITKSCLYPNIGQKFNTYRVGLIKDAKYKIYILNHANTKENWEVFQEVTGEQLAQLLTAPCSYFKYNLPNKKW